MVSRSWIWGARRKTLIRLEGLLETVSLEMTMESVGADTHWKIWWRGCQILRAALARHRNVWLSSGVAECHYYCCTAILNTICHWTIAWMTRCALCSCTTDSDYCNKASVFNTEIAHRSHTLSSHHWLTGLFYLSISVFGRPSVKWFALCYETVVCSLSIPVCLWRWCIVTKRFDGSRWNLVCR